MAPLATTFEPSSRFAEFSASLRDFGSLTPNCERRMRALWQAFTPHRLVRRYSEYGWLNHQVKPALSS